MALIKLCFAFLIFCLACGAVGSFFVFLFDVIKWHMQEKRTIISASAQKLPKLFKGGDKNGGNDNDSLSGDGTTGDSNGDCHGDCGSGSDADFRSESTERTTSVVFDSWLQS